MKAYFISSLFPDELKEDLFNNSVGATANANNAFQWALFNGLKKYYPDLFLLNFPNVGAYPIRFKRFEVKGSIIRNNETIVGKSFSFINLIQIKHYVKYILLCGILKEILSKDEDSFVFFIYDLYPPFLRAVNNFKEKNPDKNIRLCLIVPDLHGLTGASKNIFNSVFFKFDEYLINKSYKGVDYFVFLSRFMAEIIPVKNKPWVCVEGIFQDTVDSEGIDFEGVDFEGIDFDKDKIVFYSGALDERNGVINLLKAFERIEYSEYKLLICGEGPLRSLIDSFSKNNDRIVYLGQVSRDQVLFLQKKSTLLVNPRLPDQNFTRYSFPSKTMEYLASGTPTLMYKLEGVPIEYYNYCFVLEDKSIDSLCCKILEICKMDVEYLLSFGENARSFILENKNPETQCLSIYNMIKE